MNNATLMATVASSPQMRYGGSNNDLPIAEAQVEFPNPLDKDGGLSTVTASFFGKTAESFHQDVGANSQVILQGSWSMTTVERPEGFKEKVASFSVSTYIVLGGAAKPLSTESRDRPAPAAAPTPVRPVAAVPVGGEEPDYDDIPF